MIDITDIGNLDDFDPDSVGSTDPFESDDTGEGYNQNDEIESDFDFYGMDGNEFEGSDVENTESLVDNVEENISDSTSVHRQYRSSNIAFTGNGRCRVCNCGGWAGFGDTCANCGHFYNKHI